MEKLDRLSLGRLWEIIRESRTVTMVSHTHPDGDAVGSSVAMCAWMSSMGKDAAVMLPTPVPESLSFVCGDTLPMIFSLESGACLDRLATTDLLVCLDFNDFSRAEGMAGPLASCKARKVLIDHHLNPSAGDFDLCFSDTAVSSACELLFNILLEMPPVGGDVLRLPSASAKALMTGMTTDTNNFANSVYPSTFAMASALLDAGVDRDAILSSLYNNYRENRVRLFGEMLKDRLTITPCGVAVMYIDAEVKARYDIREGESEGLVNQPLAIGKVKMSILVKEEDDGQVRVSVRSKRGVSANQCAREFFHGGGHEQAAGGKIIVPDDLASPGEVLCHVERVTGKFMERYA